MGKAGVEPFFSITLLRFLPIFARLKRRRVLVFAVSETMALPRQ